MHEFPIRGHVGMNRMYIRLRHFINWEGMKRDVDEYIENVRNVRR
jgi:hypothetical protein